MRVLVQRVQRASVEIDGEIAGIIDPSAPGRLAGLLLLVGIGREDDEAILEPMARKIVNLRIFADGENKMNRSILEEGGSILAVSQFTLHADCRKGRRPSFLDAAPPDQGRELFDRFVATLRATGVPVQTGRFGAMMNVQLVNAGPVTIWLDSRECLA